MGKVIIVGVVVGVVAAFVCIAVFRLLGMETSMPVVGGVAGAAAAGAVAAVARKSPRE